MKLTLLLLLCSYTVSYTVEDPELNAVLTDQNTFWYNDDSMPPVYQKSGSNNLSSHVHSVNYNISADPNERFGNGNREFPWAVTAGTSSKSTLHSSVKFLSLPRSETSGNVRKIAVYRDNVRKTTPPGYYQQWRWTFPVGTVVGELLLYRDSTVYEIRTRTREYDDWAVDIYRPYSDKKSAEDLFNTVLTKKVRQTVSDEMHPAVFPKVSGSAWVVSNSVSSNSVTNNIRDATFTSVLGEDFFLTSETDGVIPRDYFSSVIGMDREECSRCHRDTGKDVSLIQPRRDWYGAIRGSDGIFSWHPFENASTNGADIPVSFNKSISHLYEFFDENKHSSSDYTKLPEFNGGRINSVDSRTVAVSSGGNKVLNNTVDDCDIPDVDVPGTTVENPLATPVDIQIDYERIIAGVLEGITHDPSLQQLLRGPIGAPGLIGKTGPIGATGAPGLIGKTGPPGKTPTAFDITNLPPITIELYDSDGKKIAESSKKLGETFRLQLQRAK